MKILLSVFTTILVAQLSLADSNLRVGRKVAQNKVGKEVESTKTGKERAQEYFKADAERAKNQKEKSSSGSSGGSRDHYLAIHGSNYMQSEAWLWGTKEKQKDIAKSGFGVTYRFDQWGQSDLDVRFELNEFNAVDQKQMKFSIMPVVIFPEADSQFPLYFGAGAGVGVFFKQVEQESSLSFDYQLFMGARFFNIAGSTGFFIETGLKNHVQLLSDGQLNGTYLALGALFTF